MASTFENSIFSGIFNRRNATRSTPTTILGGVTGSAFSLDSRLEDLPLVLIDFETTGLQTNRDRIIEIGAIKYEKRKEVAVLSCLVDPKLLITADITRITHITQEMLTGMPPAEQVLPDLHEFLRGSVVLAHNAEFDAAMLAHESARLGIRCSYHALCTLKMARALVKNEGGKSLDALSEHYNLSFEARHRSIGDIRVTAEVLWRMLDENPKLQTLRDLEPYRQEMLEL